MDMFADNKTLRKSHEYFQYVIIVHRDGCFKYISKDFEKKNSFKHTVLLGKARKFYSHDAAQDYVNKHRIGSVSRIAEIRVRMDVL